jgi:hypothetical protein
LPDGTRFYFEPQEVLREMFLFFTDSMDADFHRDPRPEPPDVLKAVANAKDRREVLTRVMGGFSFLPVDAEALVERGEFVPRSLVAAKSSCRCVTNCNCLLTKYPTASNTACR